MVRYSTSVVWLGLLALAHGPFPATHSVQAADPEILSATLKQESEGKAVDRRQSVKKQALGSTHVDDLSRWHAGLVQQDQSWKPIEELSLDSSQEAYEKKRAEIGLHPDRHLMLARWCRRNDLPDQARAHYFGVIVNSPNHREAREFLGHVLVGANWVDQTELAAQQRAVRLYLDQLEDSVPGVKRIVEDIHSGVSKRMLRAFEDLEKLDGASNLAALEFFSSNIDDDLAKPLIRKIAKLRSADACAALVRIAIAHPSNEVRSLAADRIREYPKHYYVPQLLSMLSTETELSSRLVMHPNGTIGMETLLTNELQNRKQMQRAQKLISVVAIFSSSHSLTLNTTAFGDISYWSNYWNVPISSPKDYGVVSASKKSNLSTSAAKVVYVPRQVALVAAQNLSEQGKQAERAVASQNRALKERLNVICSLLRATTEATELGDDAESWWTWWNDQNERYEEEKPTATAYSRQRQRLVIASRNYSTVDKENSHDFGKMTIQYSCLVPGTQVQTASGLVAIEKIKIGDLVVSQDVETAELTLKPVILTTVRPPKSTIKIVLDEDTIEATGGHYWFISGKGWVKTRDLSSGMVMHTATGSATIQEVILSSEQRPTYNLVVDDFHTYFVGSQRVLSYDNSLLKPTLRQVPGYGELALD